MKSVGLITFHTPINYGAALQSVALSLAIEDIGASCTIINYINPAFKKAYKVFNMRGKFSIKNFVWNILMLPRNIRQKRKFSSFVKNNCKLTKKYLKNNDLKKLQNNFDVFFTGSDQVWNLKCSGNEEAYFLDFVTSKPKCSYAASFGDLDITNDLYDKYNLLLKDFSKISVRESFGVEFVKTITGKDCIQTLDPTLLLNKKQWEKLVEKKKRLFDKPYVLMYFMARTPEIEKQMMAVAYKISKEKKCEILIIGGSLHKKKNGIHYVNVESPEDFVALFRDADYVVTNSFHGTAFSVNFNKNFYSYVKPDLTIKGRVDSLLEKIDLKERIFSYSSQVDVLSDVEYLKPSALLKKERESSLQFLKEAINGN